MLTSTAGSRPSAYSDLTWTSQGLFFLTDDLTGAGTELWCSDGTMPGTRMVLDIGPGQMSGPVSGTLAAVLGGSHLLFGATDLVTGLQLWLSDGTAAGTQRVTSLGVPGVGFVSFAEFFATGTRLFFAADDGISGVEPWFYDPSGAGVAFALPYGPSCNGTAGGPVIGGAGLPSLGNTSFAITLDNALPSTFAFQLVSFVSSNIAIGNCRQLVGFPLVTGASVFTDPAGQGAALFPIPTDPAYLGLNVFFQWGIVDPMGQVFGTFAASNGLQVRVGP